MKKFDIEDYSVVQELGGSSKPLKIEHKKTKEIFCLKKYRNLERMMNEYYANRIYKVAGAPVPEIIPFPSSLHLLIQWIDGDLLKDYLEKRPSPDRVEQIKVKFSRFFLIDCLIANWDVVGLEKDNVIVDKNDTPFRVDMGGCMGFRAMGERKSQFEWGSEFVSEMIVLKDYQSNPNAAMMFSKTATTEFLQMQYLHFQDNVKLISKINQIKDLPRKDAQIIEKRWKYISNSISYQQNRPPPRQQQQQQQQIRTFGSNQEEDEIQEAIRRSLLEK